MNPSVLSRAVVFLLLVCASAQSLAAAAQTAPPCKARPEYRQFDFWVGEWDVQNPQGQTAGTNRKK